MVIKVLHLITRLIVGGAQENTIYTAALLDKSRFQVELLSGPQTGSEGSLIAEAANRTVPITIIPQLVRQASPYNDIIALHKIVRLIRREGYKIVHTHSSKAGILGRLAARLAGVPVIVHTVHGWSFHDYMHPALRRLYITLERWAATHTNALIVVTERDISKGIQAGIGKRDQYTLIRSAIPLKEFDPAAVNKSEIRRSLGISQDAIVVGNVGRFSPQKNPLDWVRVAGEVGRAHPEAQFLLVGDGPLRSQVETAIVQAGLKDRSILTGLRRDVAAMMAAMDVFLLTSLWEGLPRVIPQAMAMQLPVIANRADGTAEAIQHGETGYLCPPGGVNQAVTYCNELIEHPEFRLEMGRNGRAFATREFDLRRMIAQIEDLYESLLSPLTEPQTGRHNTFPS